MLETLITSKTRIKLLLKFFLNSNNTGYLRSLEPEFGESTNAIRQELNRFEGAGLLRAKLVGNKKIYKANTSHPLFPELNSLLMKYVGLDEIVEHVVLKLGKLREVYLIGELARGKDSQIIHLWFIGETIDESYLAKLINKAEAFVHRSIEYKIMAPLQLSEVMQKTPASDLFLLWKA